MNAVLSWSIQCIVVTAVMIPVVMLLGALLLGITRRSSMPCGLLSC